MHVPSEMSLSLALKADLNILWSKLWTMRRYTFMNKKKKLL